MNAGRDVTDGQDGDDMGDTASASGTRVPCRTEPSWMADARCRDEGNPLTFFSSQVSDIRKALSVCERCPVRAECLTFAVANDERWGVWGGIRFDNAGGR